jgi:UDP:flavonoid glycosyltransferase YjiC (YdhE family)
MARPRYALFTTIPFVGHLNPLLRQSAELARRGWRVDVAAHEEIRGHVEGKEACVGYVSLGSYGPVPKTLEELESGATLDRNFVRGALAILRWLDGLWPTMFDGLRAAVRNDRPDLLVADLFAAAAIDVADAEGIPVAVNDADLLGSLPSALLPAADHLPRPLSGRSRHQPAPALQLLAQRLGGKLLSWIGSRRLDAHRRSRGLPVVDTSSRLRNRLVLIDSAFGLEYPRPLPPLLQMVGPMLPEVIEPLPSDYASWLGDGPPVVYANLGTVAIASERLLGILREGFAAEDFRVLWGLRRSQHALLPTPLPGNLRVEAWVPSPLAILAHPNVKVFVSHCGINSVHESLYAGTPIVGIPLFGDQLDMGLRVQDAGVGLLLGKGRLTATGLREAIRRVLSDPSFTRNIPAIQSSFSLAGGVRRAADLIEHLADVGIAHYAERGR